MTRVEETVTIVNERGLHARASAKFVTLVAQLGDAIAVHVARDGQSVTGTSIMGLMMLGAARGSTITISVEGAEEEAAPALAKLSGLVRDGFGED
jgi:phosphocarrier protein